MDVQATAKALQQESHHGESAGTICIGCVAGATVGTFRPQKRGVLYSVYTKGKARGCEISGRGSPVSLVGVDVTGVVASTLTLTRPN